MTFRSLDRTLLDFALLHSVLQGQVCLLLQVYLDFLLCIPVPYNEKDIFFGCQLYKVLQVFIEWFNFSFFSITGRGIDLDYCELCGEDSWTARSSNQSILKEISPEYSLEELMLMLKLQYFGYLMRRTDSFEKTLMLGKTEGKRRRGQQGMRWLVASPTQRT